MEEAPSEAVTEPTDVDTADGGFSSPSEALDVWYRIEAELASAKQTFDAAVAPAQQAYDAVAAPLETQRDSLKQYFAEQAKLAGQSKFSGEQAEVSIVTKESPKIADADQFKAWVAANGRVELFQKRLNLTEFRKFQKDNPETVPPGINVETEEQVKFKAL